MENVKRKDLFGFIREGGMYNFKGFTNTGPVGEHCDGDSELLKKTELLPPVSGKRGAHRVR